MCLRTVKLGPRRWRSTIPIASPALVLVGSSTTAVNEGVLGLQASVKKLTDPVPPEFISEFQRGTAYGVVTEPFMENVITESGKVPTRVWRDALAGLLAADSTDDLHRIQCPTLILWGDRDTIFAREEQEKLRKAIPGARLIVYPETGHAPHWEQPERFIQDLQMFVQSRA